MNKIITAGCVAVATFAAVAMPTKTELERAKPVVEAKTKADLADYKAGRKTAQVVAMSHIIQAQKTSDPAEKYLLCQGAFKLYARCGEFDLAADAIQIMKRDVKDIPPEVIAEIVGEELRYVADGKAPRLVALLNEAKGAVSATGEKAQATEVVANVVENKKTIDGSIWSYTVKNGEATIEAKKNGDFTGAVSPAPKGRFTVPAVIDGAEVRHLGKHSFMGSSISDVWIPEGVKTIGHGAFSWISGLRTVTLPSTVTQIGDVPFISSDAMERFSVAEANNSFSSRNGMLCSKDGSILISGVNGRVTIPDGVATIKGNAFHRCGRLEAVTIPPSVSNINSQAFFCSGLKSVTMLGERPNAAQNAFEGCDKLLAIHVPADAKSWAGMTEWLGKKLVFDAKADAGATASDVKLNYEVRGDGVVIGGAWKLAVPTNTTGAVVIPETINGKLVREIGLGAFAGCRGITAVTIPSGVKTIWAHAFRGCTGLESVVIPEGVTMINAQAFDGCRALKSLTLPQSLEDLRAYSFRDCKALTSVTIPAGVANVREGAFDGCTGLKTATIQPGVKDIGPFAFRNCSGLKSLTIPSSVETIGVQSFLWCKGLASLEIPEGVSHIGEGAFLNCQGVTALALSSSVKYIGDNAFRNLAVTSVIIPEGVTHIGEYAFTGCRKVKSVTIASSVTNIGSRAFWQCFGLKSVNIPSRVTNIGLGVFAQCGELTALTVDPGNPLYCSKNGMICSKDETTLVVGVGGDVIIPRGVRNISPEAFISVNVKSVIVPSSVTNIASSAFACCGELSSVTMLGERPNAPNDAFKACDNLKEIHVPANAKSWAGMTEWQGKKLVFDAKEK